MGDLPRTPTGGLVDPMKTKLEMMVAYLAGRQGEAAESIRRELEDPTSEASRWLEAVRSRSRGIFGAGSPEGLDFVATRPDIPEEPSPSHPARSATGRPHARGWPGDGCPRDSSGRLVRRAGVHRGGCGVAGTG